ncbi:aminoacyl-tRNA hydrolase [Aquihabitans sp. G128]|uniref:alternative ribosome rescue aminoacyl-tRNA hydrolase ArfB n=1 Tax=Aquihabitans sp. G128 TaxID=2849779 RepID=UPI001C21089C|nr:alternative ribosome rescue aminoacyl-tRNA hydrolase ArfB [Aquihabitans sp. G128]QXC60112.1 aminoacyl-tRNA hydrolase [Aquihabitans sp. G128]
MAGDDLVVARGVRIPRTELSVRFSASGGPGGQHANKAATRVELLFDVEASPSLLPVQRERVLAKLGPTVRIVVDEERSQLRNRTIAEERFVARLAAALHVERPRRPTKPSKGAKQRRLTSKKQRSETKANRRSPGRDA